MGFYKKLFIRISQLPAFNIGLLMCLAFFAFIKSVMLVFADIGSVQLYLTKTGHLSLGVDFILVAVLFSYVGQKTRGLFKYQGYGGFRLMTLLILVLTALIVATAYHIPGVYDGLFIVKYAYFYLINAVFWSLTTRFVPFDRRSLKNVFLMAAEAGGYFCGCVCGARRGIQFVILCHGAVNDFIYGHLFIDANDARFTRTIFAFER